MDSPPLHAKRQNAILLARRRIVTFLLLVTVLGWLFGFTFVVVSVDLNPAQVKFSLGASCLAALALTASGFLYVWRTFGPIQRHLLAISAGAPPDPIRDESVLKQVLQYPRRFSLTLTGAGIAVFVLGPAMGNTLAVRLFGDAALLGKSQVWSVVAVGLMLSLTVGILFYFRLRGALGPVVAVLVDRIGDLPRKIPSGIRGRLLLFSFAVAVLPLFFLGFLFWNQSIRAVEEQMRRVGQERLQGLAEVLSTEQTFNPSRFEAILKKFAGEEGIILFTQQDSGLVFYDTSEDEQLFRDPKTGELNKKKGFQKLEKSNLPPEIIEQLAAAKGPTQHVDYIGQRMIVSTPFRFEARGSGKTEQKPQSFQLINVFHRERRELSKAIGTLIAFGLAVALILAALIFIFSENLTGPLRRIQVAADQIARGDLTQEVQVYGDDEVGALALSFRRMHGNLGRLIGRLGDAARSVSGVADQLVERAQGIDRSSRTQVESVDDTASSIEEMNSSIGGIAANVEELAASALESASSITEMSQSIKEVDNNMELLNRSVEGAASSIGQMATSIGQIAANVEPLKHEADATSSAMLEIDNSIKGIQEHSQQTEAIADQVISDASQGEAAVRKTIESIDHMNEAYGRTQTAMNELRRTIDEIGEILKIQKSTTDGTHLLALNAAIIAAQAGVQGREFGVISNDIKVLSLRSREKTKDIEELIEKVQTTGQMARQAVEASYGSISAGVDLSARAGDSLMQILDSARSSTEMVKRIASATVEQSRGSRYVLEAIEKIANGVSEINKATQEQKKGSDLIARSTEEIKDYTRLVKRSTQEQSVGIAQVVRNIETIREMVNSINRATGELRRGSHRVVGSIETIREATRRNGASIDEMNASVKALRDQSDGLLGEVRRFKLSANGHGSAGTVTPTGLTRRASDDAPDDAAATIRGDGVPAPGGDGADPAPVA